MSPTRSALLAIFLAATVVFMAVKTYLLWNDGPWDLPDPPKVSPPAVASALDVPAAQLRAVAPDPSARASVLAGARISLAKPLSFYPEHLAG